MVHLLVYTAAANERVQVKVAITTLGEPMVLDFDAQKGLVFDVLSALNNSQNTYHFRAKFYPTKRLYANYKNFDIDLIAYINIKHWNNEGKPSLDLTHGRDVFFTLKGSAEENRNKGTLAAVRGFHYAFADFNAEKLAQNPDVVLVSNSDLVVEMVRIGRVQRGIVSLTLLHWLSVKDPESFAALDIDEHNPNHTYSRQFIVLPTSSVSKYVLDNQLKALVASGEMQRIYDRYGMKFPASTTKEAVDPIY